MTAEKPTILFSPGAWHYTAAFDAPRERLEKLGFPTEAVSLLSIGEEPPKSDLFDDAANLRAAIVKLVAAGKKVVLVAHSYSGVVGSIAVEGLDFVSRKKAGKEGGLVQFVFLSAFVLPKGISCLDALGGKYLPWMKTDGDYTRAATPEDIFYNDISEAEQKKWVAQLSHTCTKVYTGKNTYEPWQDMPCGFIFCDKDNALPLFVQEGFANNMGAGVPTFHVDSSHSPFISQPDKLVEGILELTKVGLEKSLG